MRGSDSLVQSMPDVGELYFVGDFERDFLEIGARALMFDVEENDTYGWPPGRHSQDVEGRTCPTCAGSGMVQIRAPRAPDWLYVSKEQLEYR